MTAFLRLHSGVGAVGRAAADDRVNRPGVTTDGFPTPATPASRIDFFLRRRSENAAGSRVFLVVPRRVVQIEGQRIDLAGGIVIRRRVAFRIVAARSGRRSLAVHVTLCLPPSMS